jgi:hypothetical protein
MSWMQMPKVLTVTLHTFPQLSIEISTALREATVWLAEEVHKSQLKDAPSFCLLTFWHPTRYTGINDLRTWAHMLPLYHPFIRSFAQPGHTTCPP